MSDRKCNERLDGITLQRNLGKKIGSVKSIKRGWKGGQGKHSFTPVQDIMIVSNVKHHSFQ